MPGHRGCRLRGGCGRYANEHRLLHLVAQPDEVAQADLQVRPRFRWLQNGRDDVVEGARLPHDDVSLVPDSSVGLCIWNGVMEHARVLISWAFEKARWVLKQGGVGRCLLTSLG